MNDIGITSFKAGFTRENLPIFDYTFIGGITENYVAIRLACNDHALYYWESGSKAEKSEKSPVTIKLALAKSVFLGHNLHKILYIGDCKSRVFGMVGCSFRFLHFT